jgi:hypothetical protein
MTAFPDNGMIYTYTGQETLTFVPPSTETYGEVKKKSLILPSLEGSEGN